MKQLSKEFCSRFSVSPKVAVALSVCCFMTSASASACAPADSVYMGSICATAATFCPQGYAPANGAIISIASNQALFALLGNNYGGDGRTSFGLPDLRGRSAIGMGAGTGLSTVTQGQRRGVESVVQTTAQMATHSHVATSSGGSVAVTLSAKQVSGANSPAAGYLLGAGGSGPEAANMYVAPGTSGATVDLGGVTVTEMPGTVVVGNTGSSQPLMTLPPQLGVNYCIATQGLFPPRD